MVLLLEGADIMRMRMGFVVGVVGVVCGMSSAEVISIDSGATYLRTNQDSARNTVALVLADLSLVPGDFIRLRRLGDFKPGGIYADASVAMVAVFSGSDVLLASDQLNRVQDAIDAGSDYVSPVTYYGSVPTDIPEDFFVGDTCVQIPQGASHLFVSAADSLYHDNSDPDGDFAVEITLCTCPVADLDSDCRVTLSDFAVLAVQWQCVPAEISADVYPQPGGDGFVNMLDLVLLAENWLAAMNCECNE